MSNHPDLDYRGGQGPVIHLEADARTVVEWADATDTSWAFTLSNAGAVYTEFRDDLKDLDDIDWDAVRARDFRQPDIKEAKQAEFLIYKKFPFKLIDRIGVKSRGVYQQVAEALSNSKFEPKVEIIPDWYF